jgi:hypothetical protein
MIIFIQLVVFLNLILAGLRLDLKNYQLDEKWRFTPQEGTKKSDGCPYLYKGLL